MTKIVSDFASHESSALQSSTIKIQERAFTKWCNLYLKSKGFEIDNISELHDGIFIIVLLEIVSGKNLYEAEIENNEGEEEETKNWNIISKHLEDENILLPQTPDRVEGDTRKNQIVAFVLWRIILRYQIYDHVDAESAKMKNLDYKKASKSLLKWVQSKLNKKNIENFTTDWTDGVALCQLVNSIRADTIPESMFLESNNYEMNVRLACTSAEDELGIPELLAPYDIANGKVEEKSMMTYIALFRSADRMIRRGIKTRTYTSDVSVTSESESEASFDSRIMSRNNGEGIPFQLPRCIAFGSGLRWGQVGKPAEFIVRLNGAQASDLSVSIECRPYDHRAAIYKPELQIKPIAETSYIVRYTPTRPGEYVLSIFCAGDHIPNSPFRLSVQETVLIAKPNHADDITITIDSLKPLLNKEALAKSLDSNLSLDSKHDSAFIDDDFLSSFEEITPPPWLHEDSHELYTKISKFISPDNSKVVAFGKGLHVGQVGKVGCFYVQTPNTDKGPLSVTITCPAVSIPVPCVKTKLQRMTLLHDVLYLPTEPGVYEIHVQWGEKTIPDSPFRLCISEKEKITGDIEESETNSENKLLSYRDTAENTFFIYYSASSKNTAEKHQKDKLVEILSNYSPKQTVISIAIDLELTSTERQKVFEKTNNSRIPFVFSGDKFIGSFNDVVTLYGKNSVSKAYKTTQQQSHNIKRIVSSKIYVR